MQIRERKKQTAKVRNEGLLYMLLGFLLGIVIPIFASFTELVRLGESLSVESLRAQYASVPLLMKVMPPLVLAGFAYYSWRRGMVAVERKERYTQQLEEHSVELEKRNETLDRLMYTTSHDLKTPVVNMVGLLRMLKIFRERPGGEAEITKIIEKLEISSERMLETIDDLLLVANLERDLEGQMERLSIRESVGEVIGNLEKLAKRKDASILVDDKEAPELLFSKPSLFTVLQNLVSNALHYSHPDRKPEVHVRSQLHSQGLQLQVQDNGRGIDLSDQGDKLFQMFSRLHNESAGRGVGLYTVQKIMDKVGGEVLVESEAGSGTTFTLIFPKNYIPK